MHVAELWRYPVKSMGGERLEEAVATARGLEGDRVFAVVDQSDGKVASAKHPRKWGGLLGFRARTESGEVVITFPDGDDVSTNDDEMDARLSKALGRDVTLATSGETYEADWPLVAQAPDFFLQGLRTGDGEDGGTMTALPTKPGTFFDLSGIHLLSLGTLEHLCRVAPDSSFDVRRYRPNVVIAGAAEPFVENDWVRFPIHAGAVALQPLIPTMRCIMTTLAQDDLTRDPGTLRAVSTHNRVDIPGYGTWSCVGLYAEVSGGGTVRTGDEFTVG